MIKIEKGITLVSLSITVIVLFILTGIGIGSSYEIIDQVKDDKLIGELGIVNQAITQQYSKAVALNQIKIGKSESQVIFFVGERIENNNNGIDLPVKENISLENGVDEFYKKATEFNFDYQEDFYYRLTPDDLDKIGVQNSLDTYIVNYKTGEVYNETRKVTKTSSKLLYLPSQLNSN